MSGPFGPYASRIAFNANKNAVDQTGMTTGAFVKVTFTTAPINVGSYYDAANSKWVPPAGTYVLHAVVGFQSTNVVDATRFEVALMQSGSIVALVILHAAAATLPISVSVTAIVAASGSDYFEVEAFCEGTGNKTVNGALVSSYFTGFAI